MSDTDVLLRDVTLRDGLQDEAPIPTETKLALYEALVAAGIRELELTSFVRPDRVPAMADADEMVARTTPADAGDGPVRWGLVLNPRGVDRALAAGLGHLQFVLSVSETHNQHNAGRSVDQSLDELAAIRERVGDGAVLELTLSTSFGCPYEGPIAPAAVLAVVERALAIGVDGMSLADTIGTGIPSEVSRLVTAAVALAGEVPVGAHLHDTRGLAIANGLAAIDAGAVRLDGAVGGLGGCPFAPGASGNVPLEDLLHVLDASGVRTGVDLDGLIEAAHLACDAVGRPIGSHLGLAGPRFR
jgi:hydroxymethylglutaryl-CoA lyase